MNCKDCKENMHHLTDNANDTLSAELQQHIETCAACKTAYNEMMDVINLLKPVVRVQAPNALKQNILEQINSNNMKPNNKPASIFHLSSFGKKMLAAAACIIFLVIAIPFFNKRESADAKSLENIFTKAIDAIDNVKTMFLTFNVRTDEKEGFQFIDKDANMVKHSLIKSFDKLTQWKITKPGRTVLFDGSKSYLWMPDFKTAYTSTNETGMIDWFKILLEPNSILWKEKQNATNKSAKIKITNQGNDELVSITSKAEGNFINDYLKNSSITQSDNRREYVFDKSNHLLKSLKIYLLNAGKETLIFEIENINYNTPIATSEFKIDLPTGVDWTVLQEPAANNAIAAMSSKDVAKLAFQDLSTGDFSTHKEIWSTYNSVMLNLLSGQYEKLEIIKIGEPFKSGIYPGEFVPYEIKMKDGSIKKHALPIRNDNKNKVWVVDGGL